MEEEEDDDQTPYSLVGGFLAAALFLAAYGHGPGRHEVPRRLFDLNEDPAEVLEALPRVGPALAERIVEARSLGRFHGPEDLDRRVRGIGPKTIEVLRPHLRFEPASPQ
jgi:hypothetical protein